MKYYEVRYNNGKVYLNVRDKSYYKTNYIYEGEIPILDYMQKDETIKSVDLYKVIFDKNDYEEKNRITYKNIKRKYPEIKNIIKTNENLNWILTHSSHRKDVRIVDEKTYLQIKEKKSDLQVVKLCEHIFSNHKYSFKPKQMLATKAIHKLGDISREKPDICIVSEADDKNYYGSWYEGYGFVDVSFPKISTFDIDMVKEEKYGNH